MLREKIILPVYPAGLNGQQWGIAAWLSVPPSVKTDALLVCVHGACYTHVYWDFPYRPDVYSFVQWAYERGIPTLNIDRVGIGESTHPAGRLVSMERNAEALHQVIAIAKAEGIAGHRFNRCIAVGHSLGSLTTALMQATYKTADAVVLTGIAGVNVSRISNSVEFREAFMTLVQPVADDPVFEDRLGRYDDDYFTMPPAIRTQMFFRIPPCEPALVEIDARLCGTITAGEIESFGTAADSAVEITEPVLIQMGQYDAYFFNPATESDISNKYAEAIARAPKNFTFARPTPDAGHNLAQYPGAHADYDVLGQWLETLADFEQSNTSPSLQRTPLK